jgi:hypothetical protein
MNAARRIGTSIEQYSSAEKRWNERKAAAMALGALAFFFLTLLL